MTTIKGYYPHLHQCHQIFLKYGKNTKNYDTWAIGIYCFELLFGAKPFQVEDMGDVYKLLNNNTSRDIF